MKNFMIIICEPQCKSFSHEKVNSGFIYGLRLAYPTEKIRFYAHNSHIQAIKQILHHDDIAIENIEYFPIDFHSPSGIKAIITYYFILKKLFKDSILNGVNKIFFLSFDPMILYIIKKLKENKKFISMKFSFVLHGVFEEIADNNYRPTVIPLPKKDIRKRLRKITLVKIIGKLGSVIRIKLNYIVSIPWNWMSKNFFQFKKIFLWKHSDDFRYISLSPHATTNANKYIDIVEMNVYDVFFPTVFKEPLQQPNNEYVKFAVFGYGNSSMLYKVLNELYKRNLYNKYEIRIIGMDNRGTDTFPNIVCPSPGKPLSRSDMEKYALDIDMFLILYEKERYRLTCSGSIIEALSYMKPVLHFQNECIDFFNNPCNPIGISCIDVKEYVDVMEDIINNYHSYRNTFHLFRDNIINLRNKYNLSYSSQQIQDVFTWSFEI